MFFYSFDKTLWLSRRGWPQVPLIPGRPRGVCGWLICVFLSVCMLSTKVLKPLQLFTVQGFPADTTFISVKSRVRSCEYKRAVQKKYMTCLIEVVPESTVLPPRGYPWERNMSAWKFFFNKCSIAIRLNPQGNRWKEREEIQLLSELDKLLFFKLPCVAFVQGL